MFNRTLKSVETIIGQLKSIDNIRKLLTLLLYIAYLIYRLVANNGYFELNIVLICITVVYMMFFVCYLSFNRKILKPVTVKRINRIYRLTKIMLVAVGVGLNISSFLTISVAITPLNLMFAILMPVFLVLQVVCDILFEYITYCFKLMKVAVNEDLESLKETYEKPIKAVQGIKDTVEGVTNIKDGISNIAKALFLRKSRNKKTDNEVDNDNIKKDEEDDEN